MTTSNWIERAAQLEFSIENIIDGNRFPIGGSKRIEKYSPRDGSLLYEIGEGDRSDVDSAVEAAQRSFNDRRWREKSAYDRANILRKLAELIEVNAEELALNECLDVGKPILSALNCDIPWSAASLRDAASNAAIISSPSGLDGGCFAYQLRKPIGVVAGIVGWNFPLLLACQKLGPALAMGNSIVLKPSEYTSLSTWRLAELAVEAGVPDGVVNVVNGSGATVGDALARHMNVRVLSFTGSTSTGKRLMIAAGESNMKRLVLECGGKSPYIIFDDYPGCLELLARDIVYETAFRNQGAVCVAGTRVLMQKEIRLKLLPKIIELATSIFPSDPLDPKTTFGAIVNEQHMNKILGYIDSGREDGAKLVCGGERVLKETGGYYLSPTIFDQVEPGQRIAREETFGPLVSLFSFETEEEAISLANDSEYGLAAYAATGNAARMQRLARELEAGLITITSTMEALPGGQFFGIEPQKQSGFGVEGSVEGLKPYSSMSHVSVMF